MPKKKSEPSEENQPTPSDGKLYNLQSYPDYVNLIEDTINMVFNREIDGKQANAIGMLTGYGLQALRACNQGKQRLNVFIQDMRNVRTDLLTGPEIDRFLMGSEDDQVEILKLLQERGGTVDITKEDVFKKPPTPRVDTKAIGRIIDVPPEDVKEVLAGTSEPPKIARRPHNWHLSVGSSITYCEDCGKERQRGAEINEDDACSGDWGLL